MASEHVQTPSCYCCGSASVAVVVDRQIREHLRDREPAWRPVCAACDDAIDRFERAGGVLVTWAQVRSAIGRKGE
jgi:hypothetical protein